MRYQEEDPFSVWSKQLLCNFHNLFRFNTHQSQEIVQLKANDEPSNQPIIEAEFEGMYSKVIDELAQKSDENGLPDIGLKRQSTPFDGKCNLFFIYMMQSIFSRAS